MSMDPNALMAPPPAEESEDDSASTGQVKEAARAALNLALGSPSIVANHASGEPITLTPESDGSYEAECGDASETITADMIDEEIGNDPDEGDSVPPPPPA